MPDMDSDSMLGVPVDEEERWLDALEKGELDDNGELKKEIDESLLTARQVRHRHRHRKHEYVILQLMVKNDSHFFPFFFCSVESPVAQAADPASPGAADGLQGEGDDRGDDAETGGASSKEAPAGRQKGRGEQEPDDRETDKNQQGQDQKHEGQEVQAEPEPHGALQRHRPGLGYLLPHRGPCSGAGTSPSFTSGPVELRSYRLQ